MATPSQEHNTREHNRVVLVDPNGQLITPTKEDGKCPTLVAASGQKLTCVANLTNYTLTVVAGGTYRVFARDGVIHVGVAAVAAAGAIVDSAVLLSVPAGGWDYFIVPAGVTTLNYATDSGAGVVGRIARVV